MITELQSNAIKEKYGKCSSWAIWEDDRYDMNGHGYYLNTAVKTLNKDLSSKDIERLGPHQDAILIALNFGMRDETKESAFNDIKLHLNDLTFASFHEELDILKFSGDRRQKLAYKGTKLWGAYITDLIKYNRDGDIEAFEDSNSDADELNALISDKSYMDIQISGLIEELKILEVCNPEIYVIGSKVYIELKNYEEVLKEALGVETKIVQLPHYSRANSVSDETYIKKIHEKIL